MESTSLKEFRLPPIAFKYLAVLNVLVCAALPIGVLIYLVVANRSHMITKISLTIAAILFLSFLILGSVFADRKVKNTRCIFDGQELTISKGRIFRVEHHVPRSSIIHYRITSSPLKRTFGLSSLEFHTLQGVISLGPLSENATHSISKILNSEAANSSDGNMAHV